MNKQVLTFFLLLMACGVTLNSAVMGREQHATPSSLQELRWQYRILMGELGSEKSHWQFLLEAPHQAEERKLLVLISHNGRWVQNPLQLPADAIPDWAAEAPGEMFLVGLDGGIKASYDLNSLQLSEVFTEIDGMPMRRSELLRKAPQTPTH